MTKEEFFELADKYASGDCTEKEKITFNSYYQKMQEKGNSPTFLSEEYKENQKRRSYQKVIQVIEQTTRPHARKQWAWGKIAAAVIVLLVAIISTYFYTSSTGASVNLITKSTERGQRATITLSDGTMVLLNAGSTLSFPEKFADTREIQLTGEAFFQVKRDESRPFLVNTGSVTTKVLGTSFNVKSFENESLQVTVKSGKVNVSNTGQLSEETPFSNDLLPGDQITVDMEIHEIELAKVNPDDFTAWQQGILRFDLLSMAEVAKTLERWYDVHIIIDSNSLAKCAIRATYKNESLLNVLDGLSYLVDMDYTREGDHITIYGNGCN